MTTQKIKKAPLLGRKMHFYRGREGGKDGGRKEGGREGGKKCMQNEVYCNYSQFEKS